MARLFQRLVDRIKHAETLALLTLGLLVGACTGLASVAFLQGIAWVQTLALGSGEEFFLDILRNGPAWRVLIAPTIGGLLVGLIVHYTLPKRRPVGVPQVIEASALTGAQLSSRVGVRAALASVISIGSGASVGREGPMVHLAGSIGAWIGKNFKQPREARRILMACGVSAGIAASFNAPLAGTIFALEVVLGHYGIAAFAPVVASAVVGTVISQHLLGAEPAFALAHLAIASPLEFPAFALLGLACGLVAAGFVKMLLAATALRQRLPGPAWIHPAIAGFLVGCIALALPEVLGVGYEAVSVALQGQTVIWLAIALLAAKILATIISIGGGFVGGVISPSLFVGAMVGATLGPIALALSPVEASSSSVYVLVGMGAAVAAVIGAPISTILFLFEITGNYPVTLGVMLAVVIATITSRTLGVRSFFLDSLSEAGIKVSGGHDIGSLRELDVWSHVDRTVFPIGPDLPFADVRERLLQARWGQLFVVDGENFIGSITLKSMQEHLGDDEPEQLVARKLIATNDAILAGASIPHALEEFAQRDEAHLPVIYSSDEPRLVGIVHEHDLNLAFHRAVLKARGMEDEV